MELQLDLYFEMRSRSDDEMIWAGFVVINRFDDGRYGDSIRAVVTKARVYANGHPVRNKCHFSWYCDGLPDRPLEQNAWKRCGRIAIMIMEKQIDNPTNGALYYHRNDKDPFWNDASYATLVAVQGNHLYYTRN